MKAMGDVPQPTRADGRTRRQWDRFRGWLKEPTDIRLQRPPGWVVILFVGFAFLVMCLVCYALLFLVSAAGPSGKGPEAARNLIVAISALIAAPFVILRVIAGHRQAVAARETHLTTLLTKAVEQLGAVSGEEVMRMKPRRLSTQTVEIEKKTFVPALELRIGAIYALERVAEDSQRDVAPILEALAFYVRRRRDEMNRAEKGEQERVRGDLVAALNVIGRRSTSANLQTDGASPKRRMYIDISSVGFFTKDTTRPSRTLEDMGFTRVDASECTMTNGKWSHIIFTDAVLEKTNFYEGEFHNCRFTKQSRLAHASFIRCRFSHDKGTNDDQAKVLFENAILNQAWFLAAELPMVHFVSSTCNESRFMYAYMAGVQFRGNPNGEKHCVLAEANFLAADLSGAKFGSSDLTDAVLQDARIDGADLSKTNLTPEQIEESWGDHETRLPQFSSIPRSWTDGQPSSPKWLRRGEDRTEWEIRWTRYRNELRNVDFGTRDYSLVPRDDELDLEGH